MLKLKIFNFSSQYIWPIIRPFIKKKLSRRCGQCINSEKYQALQEGICKECQEYNKGNKESKNKSSNNNEKIKEMHELLSKLSEQDIPYHVCILFSGGKDSTILVYQLMQMFPKLRIMNVTVNNGLMSPLALENMNKIVNQLKLNHILITPGDDVFKRSFKYGLEHVKGRGCSQIVDMIDGDLIHDVAMHYTAQNQIPILISGLSKEQVENIIQVDDFKYPQERIEKKRTHTGASPLKDFVKNSDYQYWWDPVYYQKLPQMIFPNYLWDYKNEQITEVLEKKCDISAKAMSPILTNNRLIPIMGVIDIRQMGYSSFEPEFAKMVRRGKVDRKYWINVFEFIEYLSKDTAVFDKDVQKMFAELAVDKKEVFNE